MKCAWQLDAVLKKRKFWEMNIDIVIYADNTTKLVNPALF
jgi:hypothetical protein